VAETSSRVGGLTAAHPIGGDSLPGRPGLAQRVRAILKVVRRIIGVPDYDNYVRLLNERHPGATPMSRREFERDCLVRKYQRPGSRCC
jgi:uncharacterized short protein YbdD (DUF466 family)